MNKLFSMTICALAMIALFSAAAEDTERAAAVSPEIACWRMLPVTPATREAFLKKLEDLRAKDGTSAWYLTLNLYRAHLDADRAALLSAAKALRAPQEFPSRQAENIQFKQLRDSGLSECRAGYAVISGRNYEPLHALRDLDRSLTREIDFLSAARNEKDAAALQSARDALRQAWLTSSRTLVEKLFALNLCGMTKERDALAAKARAIPYLNDAHVLEKTIEKLDDATTWSKLIRPLLENELALIDAPPNFDGTLQSGPAPAELTVAASKRTSQGALQNYDGHVVATLGPLHLACDSLTVQNDEANQNAQLSGYGHVSIQGVSGFEAGITARWFKFETHSGAFTFGGRVALRRNGKQELYSACSVSRTGVLGDAIDLLDQFTHAATTQSKLALVSELARAYDDDDLPEPARYLLALSILRPHLTWHAPYAPTGSMIKEKMDKLKSELIEEETPWCEAHGGEDWMLEDVPESALLARKRLKEAKSEQISRQDVPEYFWRIKDPGHPDIARAIQLLDGIKESKSARQWVADIRRNNTVVTFDVAGAYAPAKDAHAVMDVRNADKVSFKLYRVKEAAELLAVAGQIGEDFVFCRNVDGLEQEKALRMADRMRGSERPLDKRTVKLRPENVVKAWQSDIDQLRPLQIFRPGRHAWDDDGEEDYDSEESYFGDDCAAYRARLRKEYCKSEESSSWQCDRQVTIPGSALKEAGAYILEAEANGIVAYAPIVVDAMSLTLRRCRDGVFVLVNDSEGKSPVSGAEILGREMTGKAVTDSEGVAFAKIFAGGDRPIIACKDGRFAIGGFGRLFEGIYRYSRHDWYHDRWARRERIFVEHQDVAQVYADQAVIAAYTDRPTYRPGQEVNFKLIVRTLPVVQNGIQNGGQKFRAADFDAGSNLAILPEGTQVGYELVDAKGRGVANGSLKLNEFGTAAGAASLASEAAVGRYSLRVSLSGIDHLVPEIFGVQYYRRPNFELKVTGVPAKAKPGDEFTLKAGGNYYFGKPVADAKLDVRIVHPDEWRPVFQSAGKLDDNGLCSVEMKLGERLAGGRYDVIAALTDESGITVTTSVPLEIEGKGGDTRGGLAELPRFIAFPGPDDAHRQIPTVTVKTTAATVVASQTRGNDTMKLSFTVNNGTATLEFPRTGWYALTAGAEKSTIFVYGGNEEPDTTSASEPAVDDNDHENDWVNLTDYRAQMDQDFESRWADPSANILALFARHHAMVGEKLPVLVFTRAAKARLLFTFEGQTIVDYLVVNKPDEKCAYRVIEIPITERHLPDFYLQGRIVSPLVEARLERAKDLQKQALKDAIEEEDPRWCRVDVVDPRKTPGGEKLKLSIETGRGEYKPGETVDVRLKVSDLNGNPREAEVSLGAVDESVYSFGEDSVGSLAQYFGAARPERVFLRKSWRCSIGNADLAESHLRQQMDMQKAMNALAEAAKSAADAQSLAASISPHPFLPRDGERPISTIPLSRLRSDFRETAAWLPQLRSGPDGAAVASFKLPDSLTSYRLTAVGLTKQTEIGTSRLNIRASLPLSVQVFLPRFAVESDRLCAVGLVHNNTAIARSCSVKWTIDGASADGALESRVDVPANGSARVSLWLQMNAFGKARIALRSTDANDGDGEEREIPVFPLGRPREVSINDTLPLSDAAAGVRTHTIKLPDGFIADDLRIGLVCTDIAQAMDGLGYLVEYPYGCVEQTMSRFLPAVMVNHAARRTPLNLPPEIAAKLPDVLAKGLARLYNFQHTDGGWGWWEKDATNHGMSVYVVYGLARCRSTGMPIDDKVLSRGCEYLRTQLSSKALENDLDARAWLALALAGEADREALSGAARQALEKDRSVEARCNLALACRMAGCNELGERLWSKVRDWTPDLADHVALKLGSQVAFGASLESCKQSAAHLLTQRSGGRWASTKTTSWAIESISELLHYTTTNATVKNVAVAVGGKSILAVKDPAELAHLIFSAHTSDPRVLGKESLPVDLRADCAEPVHLSLSATGTQRMDKIEPLGDEVKILRSIERLDGTPFSGALKVGEIVAVRLKLTLKNPVSCLIVEDRRPAGCEFAGDKLSGELSASAANVEFRDDRVCAFFTALANGQHELLYYLRAETPGTSHILPGCAYPMYDEKHRGETGAAVLVVQ